MALVKNIITSWYGFLYKLVFFEVINIHRSYRYKEYKKSFRNPANNELLLEDSVEYIPSPYYFLSLLVKNLNKIEGAVVDVGCGSGRALRYFERTYQESAKYIGLDIDREIISSAKSLKQKNNSQIEYIEEDAKNFKFPEETRLIYLFNPFGKKTMSMLVNRIVQSSEKFTGEVFIAYVSPVYFELFESSFEKIYSNINKSRKGIIIYRLLK